MFGLEATEYAIHLKQQLEINPLIERFEFNDDQFNDLKQLLKNEKKYYANVQLKDKQALNVIYSLEKIITKLENKVGFFRQYRAVERNLIVDFIRSVMEYVS